MRRRPDGKLLPHTLQTERIHQRVYATGREFLAATPDTSISGRRVARELQALLAGRGLPGRIVSDNVL